LNSLQICLSSFSLKKAIQSKFKAFNHYPHLKTIKKLSRQKSIQTFAKQMIRVEGRDHEENQN